MKALFDITNATEVKEFIANTESGIYTGTNVDGEDVVVKLQQGEGMDYETLQTNGWIRISEYDKDGYFVSERYRKHNK